MSDEMREARARLRALAGAAATGWRIGLLNMTDEQANADAAFRGAASPRQITALLDELERVERERDEARVQWGAQEARAGMAEKRLRAAEARATAAEARLAEAVEVMRPFAQAARDVDDGIAADLRADDDQPIEELLFAEAPPTARDLRRARAFMEQQG